MKARFFPLVIRDWRNAASRRSRITAWLHSFGLVGSSKIAASPICSSAPGTCAAITGHSKAKASIGGKFFRPKKQGDNKAKAFLYKRKKTRVVKKTAGTTPSC